jgi:catechol 2,3-dioxygenase-like lactoylglutathione lyase family enzyme
MCRHWLRPLVYGTLSPMTSPAGSTQRLSDLVWLRRVRDRIDREYAQPLDVEALARGVHMSAGHLSRGLRWITVGPAGQPDTAIVLHPPAADPGITDDERRMIAEMMAKGTYAGINLSTRDLDDVFERLQARDVDVVQEPTQQPWGIRDCAVRDPAGNLIRIQELR